ncbi:MAG: GDSL-type esterase/lipase family protein [Puniceicoccales bacterium]|jgi:beta-glucosidase|nr:GDSL-type esterase/lipase family protein [Puniceicoccales bacterium]
MKMKFSFFLRALFAPALALAVASTSVFADDQTSATKPVYRGGEWRGYTQQFNRHIATATAALNKGTAKLLFFGDSITEGWNSGGRAVWNTHYASRNAINLGLSGDRTQNVLYRMDKLPLDKVKPKAVVLLIGYNNITATYNGKSTPRETAEGIKAVVTRIKKIYPSTKILVLHVLPAANLTEVKRIKEINALLPSLLRSERNVTLLDLTSSFADKKGKILPALSGDGIHLNKKGYEVWATKMEPVLKKLLNE